MWWNQVHGVGVGSTSFPKTSCRRNAWNSRSVKPLALWIYSTAILTFRRIHAREFVELVWTCILIKRDEPPKSMKENGLQKIQGCAFLQFFSACDVTNWKLKRWSAHTWQILWNKVKHLFKVLHLFFLHSRWRPSVLQLIEAWAQHGTVRVRFWTQFPNLKWGKLSQHLSKRWIVFPCFLFVWV